MADDTSPDGLSAAELDGASAEAVLLAEASLASAARSLRARAPVDYKEPAELSRAAERAEAGLVRRPTKRPRREPPFDVERARATAFALGFGAEEVSAEEAELLPPNYSTAKYALVRNYVLFRWREDVSRYLTEEEAASKVSSRHRKYVAVAWRFLNSVGHINFGVGEGLLRRAAELPASNGTVIVVGAGLAGLAAARQLRGFGHAVVVLEGHGRPGGRVYTKKMEGRGVQGVADLGGSIITGIDGNPLAVLAAQLRIPLHHINSKDVPLFRDDGVQADRTLDSKVEQLYNGLLDRADQLRDEMGDITDNVSLKTALETVWNDMAGDAQGMEERKLLDWHMANLEFANAQLLQRLSMRSWDQDDPHELSGAHCFLPGGNARLVEALADGLPIVYNSVVDRIQHAGNGVKVHAGGRVYEGDAVLVTVPVGVLKKGTIAFDPPLPPYKQEAISRMGFGLLNKVVMLFPRPFWPVDADMFGRVAETSVDRGEFFLFYSYAHVCGGPVLAALVAGEAAEAFERQPAAASVERVMAVLRRIYEPQGVHVPAPVQAVCTRWGQDPMAYGSYSSLTVGSAGGDDYDALAEPVGRLFFAGEATTRKYPATMHGAFFTGLREAGQITAMLSQRRRHAANAFAIAKRRAAQALLPKPSPADLAARRKERQERERRAAAAAEQRAGEAKQFAALLAAVFDDEDHPPYAEFGAFAVVLGQRGSPHEETGLLRAFIGENRGKQRSIAVYCPITRQQCRRLWMVPGGDEARMRFLTDTLGVKLVTRQLPSESRALLRALLMARGRPLPAAATAAVDRQRKSAVSGVADVSAERLSSAGKQAVHLAPGRYSNGNRDAAAPDASGRESGGHQPICELSAWPKSSVHLNERADSAQQLQQAQSADGGMPRTGVTSGLQDRDMLQAGLGAGATGSQVPQSSVAPSMTLEELQGLFQTVSSVLERAAPSNDAAQVGLMHKELVMPPGL